MTVQRQNPAYRPAAVPIISNRFDKTDAA